MQDDKAHTVANKLIVAPNLSAALNIHVYPDDKCERNKARSRRRLKLEAQRVTNSTTVQDRAQRAATELKLSPILGKVLALYVGLFECTSLCKFVQENMTIYTCVGIRVNVSVRLGVRM